MLNDRILLDTSVWVDYLRKRESKSKNKVIHFIETGQLATCDMVYLELMRGMSAPADHVAQILAELPFLPMDRPVFRLAADISGRLRRKGVPITIPDVVIAATAIEAGVKLFTYDKDFEKIPGLKLY